MLLVLQGCGSCNPHPTARPGGADLPQYLTAHRDQYREAIRKSRGWLDALEVDPLELREKGIKGKKKLAEQLDAYHRLLRVAPIAERPQLLERIKQVAAVTDEDRYHDLAAVSDVWFKQDATSYLRVALLMERMGLETTRYREEIKKIHPRLDAQMTRRGPHQQRVFHWYYQHFGLAEPFPLEDALEKGVIAQRIEPVTLTSAQAYELTHEVYALYEYGDRLDVDPFSEDDKAYLRDALAVLTARLIRDRDPDLLGEVVECMHYLRFSAQPAYLAGVKALLESQKPDGSWGDYSAQQKRLGDYVRQGFVLHTTLTALAALTAVFDRPMPPPAAN